MATVVAQRRLAKEYKALQESPPNYVEAHPCEDNILQWYYLITGPPNTPYDGGQYLGTLVFPADYPFKPPSIRMLTPSGRFSVNTRLCLSMSDYHPDTWNPAWSVSTILVGLLSFMVSNENTTGSMASNDAARIRFAKQSHRWNKENEHFQTHFSYLLPDPDTPSSSTPSASSEEQVRNVIDANRTAEPDVAAARGEAAHSAPLKGRAQTALPPKNKGTAKDKPAGNLAIGSAVAAVVVGIVVIAALRS